MLCLPVPSSKSNSMPYDPDRNFTIEASSAWEKVSVECLETEGKEISLGILWNGYGAGLCLEDNTNGEKLAQKLGPETMNKLVEAFEEMSERVLPSPMDDAYFDVLHTNLMRESEKFKDFSSEIQGLGAIHQGKLFDKPCEVIQGLEEGVHSLEEGVHSLEKSWLVKFPIDELRV
ncbi:hypothetical protein FNV43_RR01991 [Rhamnella rubrinervis]|uniref:Uncharacterized protein n=1 Tax=Rhamnella rubrinervis TaxID=2594499 RepID=A0A8K0HTA0_9ROSA|nr:hypothetical protein FNV43_RR01991 [Rhamnella rubrinervis]